MKKLILLLMLCSLFVCCNYWKFVVSTMEKEEWCRDDCGQYTYSPLVDSEIVLSGYLPPWCICMNDCMSDPSYCEIDSTRILTNSPKSEKIDVKK